MCNVYWARHNQSRCEFFRESLTGISTDHGIRVIPILILIPSAHRLPGPDVDIPRWLHRCFLR